MIGVFWIEIPISYPDTFEVRVDDVVRNDYEAITRKRDGAQGVLFYNMTYEETCNVAIRRVVRPRSQNVS